MAINFFKEANYVATLRENFISLKVSGTSLITVYSTNFNFNTNVLQKYILHLFLYNLSKIF